MNRSEELAVEMEARMGEEKEGQAGEETREPSKGYGVKVVVLKRSCRIEPRGGWQVRKGEHRKRIRKKWSFDRTQGDGEGEQGCCAMTDVERGRPARWEGLSLPRAWKQNCANANLKNGSNGGPQTPKK